VRLLNRIAILESQMATEDTVDSTFRPDPVTVIAGRGTFGLLVFPLEVEDLVEPAHVSFGGNELRAQESRNDLLGDGLPGDAGGQSEDIDVVVLHRLVCGVGVVGLGTADPVQFVRCDCGPCPGAADDYAAIGPSAQHGASHRGGEIGIVDRLGGVGSQIHHGMACRGDLLAQSLLQFISGMVGADRNSHLFFLVACGSARLVRRHRASAGAPCGNPAGNYHPDMDSIRVVGGRSLSGEVSVHGAKNAVLKHMVAMLLAPGKYRLDNVPGILDVDIMGEVLDHVGARCTRSSSVIEVDVPEALNPEAPLDLVRRMRASILILGALLTRVGSARVALPGGDDFGSRPIGMHLDGLAQMGAEFELRHGVLEASAPNGLTGAEIYLDFPSVGATENLLFAAVLADGKTTIGNAAREPELADLAMMLNAMGGKVAGAGTSTIEVHGVPALQPADHTAVADRLVAGTYALAAAATGGNVTIKRCDPDFLRMELRKMEAAGCVIERGEDWFRVAGPERPEPQDIATLPYPGFHTDMHPQMVAFLTRAKGTSLVTENVYAARFRYIGELNRMGADVHADGQHVVIRGVPGLSGCEVDGCDIRAAAALVIAGLTAEGETIVRDAEHVDRGYDGFVEVLASLGADIDR
jgi:UDP-N-acetylglucosamine 1-carboxyvinyltransferase